MGGVAGILGFSYADTGALVGGFTPAGFVGSTVLSGTLAGVGAVLDGRDTSGVLTEAGVAAIGAAGGGWAGGELARAGMKLVAPRLARVAIEGAGGGLQKIGLEAAETGNQPTTPPVKLPTRVTAEEAAGIPAYADKVEEFNTMIDGFVRLDRQVLDRVAAGVKDIDEQGRLAVSRLIETTNKDAGSAPPSGKSLETYALYRANDAFADGREILSQAIVMSRGVAGDVDQNTDRMNPPPDETPEPEPEGPGGR